MCGIIACRTSGPAIEYLRIALRRLEYRGYDSVGVAVRTNDGGVERLRAVGRVDALDRRLSERTGAELDGVGIGHTRWATHGSATEDNAHPHVDCFGEISLVHNGIIENADRLRHALLISGHRFASDVDSEVLCHLIEDQRRMCGDLFEAVEAALVALQGSWAIAVLEHCTGRLVVAADHSPLLVASTRHGQFATSDIAAIADWTDEFRVLEDGDVVELGFTERWRNHELNTAPRAASRCLLRQGVVELNGYSDYMAKEIDEQPEVVARVLDEVAPAVASGALWRDLYLESFDRVHVIGCGTSLNAGQVLGNLVRRIGGLPVTSCVGSEDGDSILEPRTLRLAISQSGETADVLHAVESHGITAAPLLAVTNNAHSTLTRRADAVVLCNAGTEIGVAATKTFVCQVVAGSAVMISAMVALRRLSTASAQCLVDELLRLPDQLAAAITTSKCIVPQLADGMTSESGVVFLARSTGLPYAAEGALKLKELTYRWAELCPAGELKHGPLALIDNGTPVIIIDSGDPKLATCVAEVRARGGRAITIGPADALVPLADDPQLPWGPLTSVVPLQILARTLALALARDVDKPRNLAKSVTVE